MKCKTVIFRLITDDGDRTFGIPVNNGVLYKLSKAGVDIFKLMAGENVTYDIVVDSLAVLFEDEGVTKEQLLEQPPAATNNILECFMNLVMAYQEDMNEGTAAEEGEPNTGN